MLMEKRENLFNNQLNKDESHLKGRLKLKILMGRTIIRRIITKTKIIITSLLPQRRTELKEKLRIINIFI